MVKYKDRTENDWKSSQCPKKKCDRPSESLENYSGYLEAKYTEIRGDWRLLHSRRFCYYEGELNISCLCIS